MDAISVLIQRLVYDQFPGFVQCMLVDADGCEHQFVEKGPVVSTANLVSDSVFPQQGYIACVVQDEWIDDQGRELVRVSLVEPWDIESVDGATDFSVLREQIVRI